MVNSSCRYNWVQSKRHRLCFLTKTCSCYSTKTYVNSMILDLKLNSTLLRNIYFKSGLRWAPHTFLCICFSTKSNSIWGWGLCCLHKFLLSNNYTSLLRTTTCDALIVPSEYAAVQTLSSRTRSMLISLSTSAMMMSIPLLSCIAMAFWNDMIFMV